MHKLIAGSVVAAALTIGLAGVPAWGADADPTVHQIYEAASSGHLEQAQQMMNQVLRDHPESSKAHFVQSELYAREGNPGLARSELARAEQLDPGLPKENPRAVEELRAQLGLIHRSTSPFALATGHSQPRFPWGTVVILALVVGVFWMLFRRRRPYVQYSSGGAPGASSYGPGGYGGPGGGPGYVGPGGAAGGGIGSNIAGGLAGGLAAGAGIVAGEELAHHFLDGNGNRQVLPPSGDDLGSGNVDPNSDMGGTDFGVDDPGSWDDGSSGGGGGDFGGGGGGGDDWT